LAEVPNPIPSRGVKKGGGLFEEKKGGFHLKRLLKDRRGGDRPLIHFHERGGGFPAMSAFRADPSKVQDSAG